MIKLKAAKCPNCGADIEVNDKLEKTICQFCGSTILIQEAIENYKVEVAGKVEVEGIKGRGDKLSQAKKHMALEEYDRAKKILLGIIVDDQFDTEAYIDLVKCDIGLLNQQKFNENIARHNNVNGWELIDEIYKFNERIKKIDEEKIADGLLEDVKEDLEKYLKIRQDEKEKDKSLNKIVNKLNNYLQQTKRISSSCASAWVDEIVLERFSTVNYFTRFQDVDGNGSDFSDQYELEEFTNLTTDGILKGKYRKITTNYSTNPRTVELIPIHRSPINYDQIEGKMEEIEAITPEYITKSTTVRNKEINKHNGKIDRENAVTTVKNSFKYVIIGFLCLWILFMIGSTISVLINSGIVAGIAMILLLDSWLIGTPVRWIIDTLHDIKMDNSLKKIMKDRKEENI